jgi:hypothetical protein
VVFDVGECLVDETREYGTFVREARKPAEDAADMPERDADGA